MVVFETALGAVAGAAGALVGSWVTVRDLLPVVVLAAAVLGLAAAFLAAGGVGCSAAVAATLVVAFFLLVSTAVTSCLLTELAWPSRFTLKA